MENKKCRKQNLSTECGQKSIDIHWGGLYNYMACGRNWNSDCAVKVSNIKGGFYIETDVSAKGETKKNRARLQKKDENKRRKKRLKEKKSKRKKSFDSIEAA